MVIVHNSMNVCKIIEWHIFYDLYLSKTIKIHFWKNGKLLFYKYIQSVFFVKTYLMAMKLNFFKNGKQNTHMILAYINKNNN